MIKSDDAREKDILILEELFEPRTPKYNIDDIILSVNQKKEFKAIVSSIKNHEILYSEWGLSKLDKYGKRSMMNFYGPPGTGKTMSAEAIASYMKSSIIEVNYAEIESKYVGETPKNIVAAFRKAEKTRSVLFFDEADSILGKRLTKVTQAADHGVNVSRSVMLRQMDLFSGVVVFCSNLFENYDQAFIRRILYHINFPIPNKELRCKIWEKLLIDDIPGARLINIDLLTEYSDGMTGGDIKNSIISAASHAIQRKKSNKILKILDLKRSINEIIRVKKNAGLILKNN